MVDDTQPMSPTELQDLLKPLLRDGDAFVVRKEDGEAVVSPAPDEIPSRCSLLQSTHPKLYGQLLGMSQRVSDSSGCGLALVGFIFVAGLCFSLHAHALHLAKHPGLGVAVLAQLLRLSVQAANLLRQPSDHLQHHRLPWEEVLAEPLTNSPRERLRRARRHPVAKRLRETTNLIDELGTGTDQTIASQE